MIYNDLKNMIGEDEKILWEGKPNKKCSIFESIFNPLLPFSILWAVIDFSAIVSTFNTRQANLLLLIPFFILHLMPVWIYLGGILLCKKRYDNTYYIITNQAIYSSKGILNKQIQSKPFAEMSHINLHRGLFDQFFQVGDIICTSDQMNQTMQATINISNISNYIEIYNMIKKLQLDIYTDIMYPNDKRPPENHGYHTEYKQ